MGFNVPVLHQYAFNLRGEYIDAPDDQHIIGTSGDLVHAYMGSAAHTGFRIEGCDVPCAVTDDGKGLFGDGGEHQLSGFAIGQDFTGVGIDHLGDEMIFKDMQPFLGLTAFNGDTRVPLFH